jgi:UDP-3-O-[3-hydroxymyristoyl] N-acetylglucosamine deacetylase
MFAFCLKKEVVFSGRGLFSGRDAVVRVCPAPIGSGIVFKRTDLPHSSPIPAKIENVQDGLRCTVIGKDGASVQTVEHLMAALRGLEIDNVSVEIAGPEVPIFDGSSLPFVQMFQEAGIVQQQEKKAISQLTTPVFWSKGDLHLIAVPSEEYRISYTLHYPNSPYLRSQYFSIVLTPDSFAKEIAPCRTFSLYEEIAPLLEKGLLKGGGLENGVVIKDNQVMNPEGVRFPDEMVRHKILDLVGDLALVGFPFLAHIIAIRCGHSANHAFAKQLVNHLRRL